MGVISRRIVRRRIDLSVAGNRTYSDPSDGLDHAGDSGASGTLTLRGGESLVSVEARVAAESTSAWSTGQAALRGVVNPFGGAPEDFSTAQTIEDTDRTRVGVDAAAYGGVECVVTTAESGVILELVFVLAAVS